MPLEVSFAWATQKVTFPAQGKEAKSPSGRYVVRSIDSDGQYPAHTLTLTDRQSSVTANLYEYGRSVDLLWSPGSDAFVVNDHEGSDASHPVLFRLPLKEKPVDLREKLTTFLRGRGKAKSVEENHHVYFVAERWVSKNEILCKVWGYGEVDPDGFTKDYVYTLDGRVLVYQKEATH